MNNPAAPRPDPYQGGVSIVGLDHFNTMIPTWGVLHAFAWYARQVSSMPPAAHTVGAALPILAFEASRRGYVIGPRRERPRVQVALVGASGAGKSTSMRIARDFYRAYLRSVEPNTLDPFVTVEGSVPGVLEQLSMRTDLALDETRAIMMHEEFTAVLRHRDSISETLNQLFDGETITRYLRQYTQQAKDNQNERVLSTVSNPTISALFATTQTGLETATMLQTAGGLFGRLLWFAGAPGEITHRDQEVAQAVADAAHTSAQATWRSWAQHLDAAAAVGATRVIRLHASCNDLLAARTAWVNEHRNDERRHGMRVRLLNAVRHIASLFAFSRGTTIAMPDDVERAIQLTIELEATVFGLEERWAVGSTSDTPTQAEALRLHNQFFDLVLKAGHEGLPRSAFYALTKNKSIIDKAIEALLDQSLIEEVKLIPGPGGGRPKTLYRACKGLPPKLTANNDPTKN